MYGKSNELMLTENFEKHIDIGNTNLELDNIRYLYLDLNGKDKKEDKVNNILANKLFKIIENLGFFIAD